MIALITGSTSGIGAACAHRFASAGWEVMGVARGSPTHPCDVADTPALMKIVASQPEIDAIVHCAYTYEPGRISRVGQDALEVLWTFGSSAMRKRGGAFVILSSVAVKSDATPYAIDKRAQESRAKAFAKEGAPQIRVNVVRPHLVAPTRVHPKPDEKRALEVPLERYGRPQEVAECVYLAATCKHMTGSVITIDGGYSLCR